MLNLWCRNIKSRVVPRLIYGRVGVKNIIRNKSDEIISDKCQEISLSQINSKLNSFEGSLENSKTSKICNLTTEINNGIGTIYFETIQDNKNWISVDFLKKFTNALNNLNENNNVHGIVFRSKKSGSFLEGADYDLLKKLSSDNSINICESFQNLIRYIKFNSKPTISLIEGSCYGGGLEIVLATTYRIAIKNKNIRFGFPELKIGLIPGGLGTYLCLSHFNSGEMIKMLFGKNIGFDVAVKLGLIDYILPEYNCDIDWINDSSSIINVIFGQNKIPLCDEKMNYKNMINQQISKIRDKIACRYLVEKHFSSLLPYNPAITHLKNLIYFYYDSCKNGELSDEYCLYEAKIFSELLKTPENEILRNFVNITQNHVNSFNICKSYDVNRIGIVGAGGTMGTQLSELLYSKYLFPLTLVETDNVKLDSIRLNCIEKYNEFLPNKSRTYEDNFIKKLKTSESCEILKDCDWVIETISEDLNTKCDVLKNIEKSVSSNTIISSNTSSISLSDIYPSLTRPQNFIGIHFFQPINKTKVVEIIQTKQTSPDTLSFALDIILNKLHRIPIIVQDKPGFYTSRIMGSILAEVVDLYSEYYSPATVDFFFRDIGFQYRISELIDSIGVDVCYNVYRYLCNKLGETFSIYRTENFMEYLIYRNALGMKSPGGGIFPYSPYKESSNIVRVPTIYFYEYFSKLEDHFHPPKFPFTIKQRIMFRFLNECCRCLEEGVISSPYQGDIAAVYGVGFPAVHGGPFKFIDDYTPQKLIDDMDQLNDQRRIPSLIPSKLLLDMASKNIKFYQ